MKLEFQAEDNCATEIPNDEPTKKEMVEMIPLKIFIIGDNKKEVLDAFMQEKNADPLLATVGLELRNKAIQIDGKSVHLKLCIDAYTSRYLTVTSSYCKGVDGIALVYNVNRRDSLEMVRKWLKNLDPQIPRIVLANGCTDLEDDNVGNVDEGLELSREHRALFLATDHTTGYNIEEAFGDLARVILSSKMPGLINPPASFQLPQEVPRRRKISPFAVLISKFRNSRSSEEDLRSTDSEVSNQESSETLLDPGQMNMDPDLKLGSVDEEEEEGHNAVAAGAIEIPVYFREENVEKESNVILNF